MAENETSQQERTEQPTPKRREDSRKKGQVARSRELGMMLVTLTGAVSCMALKPYFAAGLVTLLESGLGRRFSSDLESEQLVAALAEGFAHGIELLLPLMAVLVVAAVFGTVTVGGFVFSFESLKPNLAKLNPISGLKRVFGWNGLAELLKALAKFTLVALVATVLLLQFGEEFFRLGRLPVTVALSATGQLIGLCAIALASTLILIAMADVPFQIWQHNKRLRMTKQELKDEQKETDGRPEVRSRIRRLQQETANRRMMEAVPKADVVATNPSHFAVALKYEMGRMGAPRVVAKGADLIAQNIRRVAIENKVPLFEHPPLARALFYTTALGDEIPRRLYSAVAQVLTYVYQLKNGPHTVSSISPPVIDVDHELTLSPAARLQARRSRSE